MNGWKDNKKKNLQCNQKIIIIKRNLPLNSPTTSYRKCWNVKGRWRDSLPQPSQAATGDERLRWNEVTKGARWVADNTVGCFSAPRLLKGSLRKSRKAYCWKCLPKPEMIYVGKKKKKKRSSGCILITSWDDETPKCWRLMTYKLDYFVSVSIFTSTGGEVIILIVFPLGTMSINKHEHS